jgi:hypothetical protein
MIRILLIVFIFLFGAQEIWPQVMVERVEQNDLTFRDVGVLSIDAPYDIVVIGLTYPVMATVQNFGEVSETFDVIATIDDYIDTVQVVNLVPDSTIQVSFEDWYVPVETTYTMTVCTYLIGDSNSINDCTQMSIVSLFADGSDVAVSSLNAPADTVFTDSIYSVTATVANLGIFPTDTFDVVAIIDGYNDTVQSFLNPGNSSEVNFDNWIVPSTDSTTYTMTVCAYDMGDIYPFNDCAQKAIFAYTPVGIEEGTDYQLPVSSYQLYQNTPNPFSKLTDIGYQLKAPGHTTLKIYDTTGRLVTTLVDEHQKSGVYQVEWDGKDQSSGIYFYRLISSDNTTARKMIVLR